MVGMCQAKTDTSHTHIHPQLVHMSMDSQQFRQSLFSKGTKTEPNMIIIWSCVDLRLCVCIHVYT